jgi:DNA helicase-2/ATP-dependent DNA helicase PcrA
LLTLLRAAARLFSPGPAYLVGVASLKDNPEQQAAFDATGHCVVLAGPGSGKTRVLTLKIARMLAEEVRAPRGLACLTYSTECVRELVRRLRALGVPAIPELFVGSVHTFCFAHIIRPYAGLAGLELPEPLGIAPLSMQKKALAWAAEKVSGREPWYELAADFAYYRRTVLDRSSAAWRGQNPLMARIIEKYERGLLQRGVIDFDDMILIARRLVMDHPSIRRALTARFPILAVDEYQDLGAPLHDIVTALTEPGGMQLFAVGDPDQSIYGFMGAQSQLLRTLASRDDVRTIQLRYNYRSGSRLVRSAASVLGESRDYESRNNEPGEIEFHHRPAGLEDQAAFIFTTLVPSVLAKRAGRRPADIAVVYPTQSEGALLAAAAAERGIPFERIDKGAPYAKTPVTRWVEACAAWCAGGWRDASPRLADLLETWRHFSPSARVDLGGSSSDKERALTTFLLSARDPEAAASEWVSTLHFVALSAFFDTTPALADEKASFDALAKSLALGGPLAHLTVGGLGGQTAASDHVTLITMHSAKGREFDVVILFGADEGRIPHWGVASDPAKASEARRTFYVGLTRACHEVHFVYSGWTENARGRRFEKGRSSYLDQIEAELSAE